MNDWYFLVRVGTQQAIKISTLAEICISENSTRLPLNNQQQPVSLTSVSHELDGD